MKNPSISKDQVQSVKRLLDVYAPDTFDLEMAAAITSRAVRGHNNSENNSPITGLERYESFKNYYEADMREDADGEWFKFEEVEKQSVFAPLAELVRYVSMECYDKWLPDGQEKTSALTKKLNEAGVALSIVQRNYND